MNHPINIRKIDDLVPDEAAEMRAFFSWVLIVEVTGYIPEIKTMHHIPNGEKRSKGTAGKLKAMGVRAGVWDIFWPYSSMGYHGLYIEMKKRKGGRLSTDQKKFREQVTAAGYLCLVANGHKEAQDLTMGYYKKTLRICDERG